MPKEQDIQRLDKLADQAAQKAGINKADARVYVASTRVYPLREGANINPSLLDKLDAALNPDRYEKVEGTVNIKNGLEPVMKIKNGIAEQQSQENQENPLQQQYVELLREGMKNYVESSQVQEGDYKTFHESQLEFVNSSDFGTLKDTLAKNDLFRGTEYDKFVAEAGISKGLKPDEVKGIITEGPHFKAAEALGHNTASPEVLKNLDQELLEVQNDATKFENDCKQEYAQLLNDSFRSHGVDIKATYEEISKIVKKDPDLGRSLDAQVLDQAAKLNYDSRKAGFILSNGPLAEFEKANNTAQFKTHLDRVRYARSLKSGISNITSRNTQAIQNNAKKTIAMASTAQKNLSRMAQKTKDFSLKQWATTQSKSIQSQVSNFVSKQVESVKDWALKQYPKLRESVVSATKGIRDIDNRIMNVAQQRQKLDPKEIGAAAATVLQLANQQTQQQGNPYFENDKIRIEGTQQNGPQISMKGHEVYSNGKIAAGATLEHLSTLSKLPDKAQEMSIKASQHVMQEKQLASQLER
jgi:hypothetical protein